MREPLAPLFSKEKSCGSNRFFAMAGRFPLFFDFQLERVGRDPRVRFVFHHELMRQPQTLRAIMERKAGATGHSIATCGRFASFMVL